MAIFQNMNVGVRKSDNRIVAGREGPLGILWKS